MSQSCLSSISASVALRHILRPLRDGLRECPPHLRARIGRMTRSVDRSVLFLPARGSDDGAVRLRIHEIARRLGGDGWRTQIIDWRMTLTQRRRLIAAFAPDVIVMQGSRHALNRPEHYPGIPILYDMDDADFHLDHLAAPVAAAMGQVAGVIAGSQYIADWCCTQGAPWARVVWTGTPVSTSPPVPHAARPPVVAWAQTRPATYHREADLVRAAMARVAARHPGAVLRLYDRRPGDDPAFRDSFTAPGLTVEWRETCGYDAYLASFDDVAVGLAPLAPLTPFSRGKSFGKVLAYLDRHVPVVASPAGEHEAFFTTRTGHLSQDAGDTAEAILGLLRNPHTRQRMADAAFTDFSRRLTTKAAAAGVAVCLDRAIPGTGPGRGVATPASGAKALA